MPTKSERERERERVKERGKLLFVYLGIHTYIHAYLNNNKKKTRIYIQIDYLYNLFCLFSLHVLL